MYGRNQPIDQVGRLLYVTTLIDCSHVLQRSQVLDKSGGDPKVLAQLLHNAQMLERMAENHKVLVQRLEMFWKSLSSVNHQQWKVETISDSHSTELGTQFEAFVQLDRHIRELDEKSQGIIQLVSFPGLFRYSSYRLPIQKRNSI